MTNNETKTRLLLPSIAFAVAFYNTQPPKERIAESNQWLVDREEIKQLLHRYNANFDEARFDEVSENGFCMSELN
jgi:hypothetical protein